MVQAPPKPYLSPAEYLAIERAAETRSEYLDGKMFLQESGRVRVLETGFYTYPDLLVVSGEVRCEDEWDDTLLNPSLILEILSPTTEAYDRGEKFHHYRKIPTLAEYVLLSQTGPCVEQFLRQEGGTWLYTVTSGHRRSVSLASIGCELRLKEIYDRVIFG